MPPYNGEWHYYIYNDSQRHCEKLDAQGRADKLKKLYKLKMGTPLHLDNPVTWTEKIQWMKLYDATPEKTRLADKYLVRDWVKEKIGDEYLIPLLGVYDSFEEIDFDLLPDKFVLKANHGSGMNLVVKDKSSLDMEKCRRLTKKWLSTDFAFSVGFEMHYSDIPRKLIIEEYIEQMDGDLEDYKFHCFNGKVEYIQVIGQRDLLQHTGYQSFYSKNWDKLSFTLGDYPPFAKELPRPARLAELVCIAEKLSDGFPYVRVDLYEVRNKTLFGEMTFTPASGFYPNLTPKAMDIEWGKLLQLADEKLFPSCQ